MAKCVLVLLILLASALEARTQGCKQPQTSAEPQTEGLRPSSAVTGDCSVCAEARLKAERRAAAQARRQERRTLYESGVALARDFMRWLTQPADPLSPDHPPVTHLTPFAWSVVGENPDPNCQKTRN
jgi:hypothetical protein